MKLTKSQRYIAYIILLSEFQEFKETRSTRFCEDGFCFAACNILGLRDEKNSYNGIIDEFFPELKKKKPKRLYKWGLWFKSNEYGGLEKRILLLNKCITETF